MGGVNRTSALHGKTQTSSASCRPISGVRIAPGRRYYSLTFAGVIVGFFERLSYRSQATGTYTVPASGGGANSIRAGRASIGSVYWGWSRHHRPARRCATRGRRRICAFPGASPTSTVGRYFVGGGLRRDEKNRESKLHLSWQCARRDAGGGGPHVRGHAKISPGSPPGLGGSRWWLPYSLRRLCTSEARFFGRLMMAAARISARGGRAVP